MPAYRLMFPSEENPLGIGGLLTVIATSESDLPGAIAEAISDHGLGTSRADLVDIDGSRGALAFTPPVRAAEDTAEFGGYATFTVQPQPD